MADGKPEAALQQFEKAATLDPENATIKTRVAVAEINSGQARQGLAQLEKVFAGEASAPVAGPALVLAELRAGLVDQAVRGRDARFWAPPAQIRASGIPALGSYLGCVTAKRNCGQG
jgi:hypothetical protein